MLKRRTAELQKDTERKINTTAFHQKSHNRYFKNYSDTPANPVKKKQTECTGRFNNIILKSEQEGLNSFNSLQFTLSGPTNEAKY